jgi:hypothetical protein
VINTACTLILIDQWINRFGGSKSNQHFCGNLGEWAYKAIETKKIQEL